MCHDLEGDRQTRRGTAPERPGTVRQSGPDRPGVRATARCRSPGPGRVRSTHLSREFKLAYGEAPYGYLMTRRIRRAMACYVVVISASPRSASMSAARPRLSAPASPSWSVCRPASTRAKTQAAGCRRARSRLPKPVKESRSGATGRTKRSRHGDPPCTRFLPHGGPEASLAFYRDTLGFEVRGDVGNQGMRWITVGPVGQPETSIVLHPPGVAQASPTTSGAPSSR